MEKTKHFILPNDPVEALHKIADFLDENMKLKGCRYPDNSDKKSFIGYWQPIEFFYDLQAIAHYARKFESSAS